MAIEATLFLLQINQYVYVDKKIDTSAFTYFSQIRVLNEESAYISTTNGERTPSAIEEPHALPAILCVREESYQSA